MDIKYNYTIEVVGGGIPFRTVVAVAAAGVVKFSFEGVFDLSGSVRLEAALAGAGDAVVAGDATTVGFLSPDADKMKANINFNHKIQLCKFN